MRLPELKFGMGKTRKQITQFLGLNLSENTREGEMADTLGLTAENYPALSPRGKWAQLTGYDAPTDIFEWDGKLVVIDGGVLYYDGEAIDSVTDGRKQFAVVNTKLCIWPDKTYIDLTNGTYGLLDAQTVTENTPGNVHLTANGITAEIYPKTKSGLNSGHYTMGVRDGLQTIYTYGQDVYALRALWNGTEWSGLSALETDSGVQGAYHDFGALATGDLFIPEKSGRVFHVPGNGVWFEDDYTPPDRADASSPYYAVVTGILGSVGVASSDKYFTYDVYAADAENALWSGVFSVGDVVDVSGVPFGFYTGGEGIKQKIAGIDDETNTVTFQNDIFSTAPDIVLSALTTRAHEAGEIIAIRDRETRSEATYFAARTTAEIPQGALLFTTGSGSTLKLAALTADGEETETGAAEELDYESWQEYIEGETASSYVGAEGTDSISIEITLRREVPDMDYICESGNRLWGVSNAQENKIWNADTETYDTFTSRCIYASALGMPGRFWDFEGVSTDSYQVAVGGEGDFTAIRDFAGGVCCFKEQRLYKVSGSYPAEYYMHEYQIAGVQNGSFRSLAVENEVLYYKGVAGVYAYTGGTPSLISADLGTGALYNAAGGTDGKRYFIGCSDAEGGKHLFSYDLMRGLWLRDSELLPEAFARMGSTMYMLSDGVILYPSDDASGTEWLAEFVPFTETAHIKKGHTKLLLRLDMDAGSALRAEVREDNAPWRLVLVQTATNACTLNIPIRLGRCDRYAVRLSGVGGVKVLSMAREYSEGSEK